MGQIRMLHTCAVHKESLEGERRSEQCQSSYYEENQLGPAPEGRPSLAQRRGPQHARFWRDGVEGFSVCVRTGFRAIQWNKMSENKAPEGRPNLAQRFSAGKSRRNIQVPEGRPSSHAHSSALGRVAGIIQVPEGRHSRRAQSEGATPRRLNLPHRPNR